MRIALFAHNFLEPTHHAIASVLDDLKEFSYSVFAKRFFDERYFRIANVVARAPYRKNTEIDLSAFDLVHIIYDGDIAFDAAELADTARVPIVLSFHGGFDTKSKIHDPRFIAGTRHIAELARVITVTSNADVRRLESLKIRGNIRVVPVAVDLNILPPATIRRETRLISIGRLIEKKGIDVALRALAVLPPEYTLNVIGAGKLEQLLYTLSQALGVETRVRWLGLCTLEKTLQTLNECGALIHAARTASDRNSEGTPQAVLWAQALGIPVVSTYSGDIPEIVEHCETGLLVAPDDPLAIAKSIVKLEADSDLRRSITLKAAYRVRNVHGLSKVAAIWRAVYRQARSIN